MTKTAVIVVAAGKGLRLGVDTPKQFLSLSGVPVLMRTIETINGALCGAKIYVVLSEDAVEFWSRMCREYGFNVQHTIVKGGSERFFSVKNALAAIDDDVEAVLVHDAVRPFASERLFNDVLRETMTHGAVVPVVDVRDSLRQISEDKSVAIDRLNIKIVQTPQGFKKNVIVEAYNQEHDEKFTDDASIVESTGREIKLVEGEQNNIKLTYQIDFLLGELILKNRFNR